MLRRLSAKYSRKLQVRLLVDAVAIVVTIWSLRNTVARLQEVPLAFETLEIDNGLGVRDSQSSPHATVITSREQVASVLAGPEAYQQLQTLDFQRYFAIVAFRGQQPTGGREMSSSA